MKNNDANLNEEEVKRIYNLLSYTYDFWAFLTESRASERAFFLSDIKDGSSILEVAVGTGLAFKKIVESNPNGTNIGIDLTEGMLTRAKKRLSNSKGNFELKIGNAATLEFPSESFDLIFNSYMFDLIRFERMDAIVRELSRVLKLHGRLVLVNMTNGKSLGSRIYNLIFRYSPKIFGGCRGIEMTGQLLKNGFTIEHHEYLEQLFFPSEIIIGTKSPLIF